jgi:hypothetical protein
MPKNKTTHTTDETMLKERTQKTLYSWFELLNTKKARKLATRKVFNFVKTIEGLKELKIQKVPQEINQDGIQPVKNNSIKLRNAITGSRKSLTAASLAYSHKKKRKSQKLVK